MVIVQLNGGQANQMFQYAAGRRLAYNRLTPLKLDTSAFEKQMVDTPRTYKLGTMNITADFASQEESEDLKTRKPGFALRFFYKLLGSFPYHRLFYLKERHFHFDPEILKAGKNVYMEGFWQSEKYFKDIEEIIRKEFTIKNPPDKYNQALISLAQKTNSVAIHVRRGDYVSNKGANEFHGICSVEYYKQAIEWIKSRVTDPQFIIFSDDPNWARENIPTNAPTEVSLNDVDHGHEDIRVMYNCKHFIIANSSFSWWGAWLGNHQGKIVIAPKHWFKDENINTGDIIPSEWIRL